jgi:hypothetical protein
MGWWRADADGEPDPLTNEASGEAVRGDLAAQRQPPTLAWWCADGDAC